MSSASVAIKQDAAPDRLIDNEAIVSGLDTVYRQRIQLGGLALGDIAEVKTTTPSGSENALLVRNIPSGTQAVSGAITVSGPVAVTGTFFQATQPVSGAFFQATQPVSIAGSVTVSGPLTDTQIRATPLPVSGTVTANTGLTQPLTDTQLRASSVPVTAAQPTGTLTNGTETAVSSSAVQILAANANRKKVIIQNTGLFNIRVGVSGVTATTGLQLIPSGSLVLDMPNVPVQAIFAIREGASDSIALTMEMT